MMMMMMMMMMRFNAGLSMWWML